MAFPLLLSAAVALAGAPDDDAIHEAVNTMYGKEVPEKAVCIARPTLPASLGDAVPVAVRRGHRGCVLLGVMIGDTLVKPVDALPAAVGAEAWADLAGDARTDLMKAWGTHVLLAFGQLEGEPTVSAAGDGHTISATYLHRTEDSEVAGRSTRTWTFDADGKLADDSSELKERWRTTFFVRPEKVTGVATETVLSALTSRGKVLKQCFVDAWEDDLLISGRVRLTWTLQGGKADNLGVMAGDDGPQHLAKCYARVIRGVEFPEDAAGDVRWSFSVVKSPVD